MLNVLKNSNFEKSAKTSKNLKKILSTFTREGKMSNKNCLFYAKFFEFEVKTKASFLGVAYLVSAYCVHGFSGAVKDRSTQGQLQLSLIYLR